MMPGAEIVPGCHGDAIAYGIGLQGYVCAVLGQADPQSPQADETIHWMPQHGSPAIVLILCGCGLMSWTYALKTGKLSALALNERTTGAGLMYEALL